METIKADELRQILFYLDDQGMTVKELRAALFTLAEGTELRVGFGMFREVEQAHKAEQARQARLEAMS